MPLYEYYCPQCLVKFETFKAMEQRHRARCPHCNSEAELRISLSDFRFAQPLTILQDLGGNRGYQKIGWQPDSGISPRPGQPYKTGKEVVKEEYGGVKEV